MTPPEHRAGPVTPPPGRSRKLLALLAIDSNATPEGRARNERVQFVVLPN